MRLFAIILLLITSLAHAYEDDAIRLRKAIARAAEDGTPVVLENREYRLFSQIVLPSGVTIQGNGASVSAWNWAGNKGGPFVIADGATNVTLQGLRINAVNCSWVVQGAACTRVSILDCDITGPIYKGYFLDFNGVASQIRIERSTFSDTQHCIRLRGAVRDVIIRDDDFSSWLDYAIQLEPIGLIGPEDITIQGSNFHDPKPGNGARQMIATSLTKDDRSAKVISIRNLRILDNDFIGTGQHFDRASETSTGTADQVSIQFVDGVTIRGNRSLYGGENGIVVTNWCRNVLIANNEASYNNGHGIQFSSRGERSSDGLIVGNYCRDNGARKGTPAEIAKREYSGIYVHDAERVGVHSNRIEETRDEWRQQYGLLITESTDVDLGPNSISRKDRKRGSQDVGIFTTTLAPATIPYHPDKKPTK